ncbi:hypothetical protein [Xanthomonas albilineans]|uniref:hypothetical protein n=1 Tax=Xanthomonas albilineans TaxID=29447 RepID=UPI000ABAB02D|nr:hypothetical protein [Xanthomonas albilineans]
MLQYVGEICAPHNLSYGKNIDSSRNRIEIEGNVKIPRPKLCNEIAAVFSADQAINANMKILQKCDFGQSTSDAFRKKSFFNHASNLVGKTIHPQVADRFRSEVSFDGTGKIIGFKKEISNNKLDFLIKICIHSINETPHLIENKIRTPGECLINIAISLDSVMPPIPLKDEIQATIRYTWLDGGLSRQALVNLIELIKLRTRFNAPELYPKIRRKIDDIAGTLEKETFQTKRNDNFYGRLFETHLSEYLIKNPDYAMMEVRDAVAAFILQDFISPLLTCKGNEESQSAICERLASLMEDDPPSWRCNIESVKKFLASKSQADFIEMMKYHGEFSVPLILSVAVKYITIAPGLQELKNKASEFYIEKIIPQRELRKLILSNNAHNKKSNLYGLMLPYQRGANAGYSMSGGIGIRPIDRYALPGVEDGMHEDDLVASSNEITIGTGVSGSSNILNFLFNKIRKTSTNFPMDAGRLAVASWLAYSGGHSFNEAYSVFSYKNAGKFKSISFKSLAEDYDLMNKGVEHAYNQVLQTAKRLQKPGSGQLPPHVRVSASRKIDPAIARGLRAH